MMMTLELSLSPFGAEWNDYLDTALLADQVGVPGLWVTDHVDGTIHDRSHVWECWTTLAALASRTQQVGLGSLVVNPVWRHPVVLAQACATVQAQSHGRLRLGLGAGGGSGTPYADELTRVGLADEPPGVRRARVASTIEQVRRSWQGDGYLKPLIEPPVIVAGYGPKMAELAGRLGDGFNTAAEHPDLARLISIVRDEATRAGRGEPQLSAFTADVDAALDPDSMLQVRLHDAEVAVLIVVLRPPFDRGVVRSLGR